MIQSEVCIAAIKPEIRQSTLKLWKNYASVASQGRHPPQSPDVGARHSVEHLSGEWEVGEQTVSHEWWDVVGEERMCDGGART
jgi:hypothetical protein